MKVIRTLDELIDVNKVIEYFDYRPLLANIDVALENTSIDKEAYKNVLDEYSFILNNDISNIKVNPFVENTKEYEYYQKYVKG